MNKTFSHDVPLFPYRLNHIYGRGILVKISVMRRSQRFNKLIIFLDGLFNKCKNYTIRFLLPPHDSLPHRSTQFTQRAHMIWGQKRESLSRTNLTIGYVKVRIRMQFYI